MWPRSYSFSLASSARMMARAFSSRRRRKKLNMRASVLRVEDDAGKRGGVGGRALGDAERTRRGGEGDRRSCYRGLVPVGDRGRSGRGGENEGRYVGNAG